ncbi:rod shape-determining protein MreD [Flavobacterium ammonificans]|jgi:rod shape-determining protein MreD|uniref:rod shape-determining protein MreD n=1 Tax=Flavobacterium ammonificans TaxID=1751056 RepID=UPI001E49FFFC|nr:rod shape-determining protein MreD [Flavobacterium ammonificans]BDB56585.1 rod shape-determining protein MreD [Flavobacterium ammonificans]
MNSSFFLNIFRFISLFLLQIIIFNNINLFGFVSPFPYVLFIILFPVNGNKSALLISSFFLGLLLDIFSNSGGIHTTASILLAYFRPSIFKFAFGVSYEYQTIKLNDTLTPERFSFLFVAILLHHLILFILEAFQFSLIFDILLRSITSTALTIIISVIIIYLIKPNKR